MRQRSDPTTPDDLPTEGSGDYALTGRLPTYSDARALLSIAPTISPNTFDAMVETIRGQRGSQADPVDWSAPESWIPDRLAGPVADVAARLWAAGVHPRYAHLPMRFVRRHAMLEVLPGDTYAVTDRGQRFLEGDDGLTRIVDHQEGLLALLIVLATSGRVRRADLLPEWSSFVAEHLGVRSPSVLKDGLRRRLVNLVERGLVERSGTSYEITTDGQAYADSAAPPEASALRATQRVIRDHNARERVRLLEILASMHPTRFENLVGELLAEMGYTDIEVTRASGDLGIDVRARIEMGITEVTEIVQVKRRTASIQRPVLDQLRGVLPLHGAIKGTIVTLGSFSRGCAEVAVHPGAAPITLIDGPRFIDLLVDHGVGVRRHTEELLEVDEDFLADASSPESATGLDDDVGSGAP